MSPDQRADQAPDGVLVGEDSDDIGSAFHLLVQPFQRVGRVELGSVLGGEAHEGKHIVLGLIHEAGELFELGPELIGNVPPDLRGRLAIGLKKGLADGSGNDGVLTFGSSRATSR